MNPDEFLGTIYGEPTPIPNKEQILADVASFAKPIDPRFLITPDVYARMSDDERAAFLADAPDHSPIKVALRYIAQLMGAS